MRVGSLFSGVGGFDLGLEQAGHEIVWQVENDDKCQSVLRKHWPSIDLYKDVCDVGRSDDFTTIQRVRVDNSILPNNRHSTGNKPDELSTMDTNWGDSHARRSNLAPVDLICGGFPCQDLSQASRARKGLAGERSGLWFEFHRILTEMLPSWVLIENVPGLLSANEGRDFATLLRGLSELRYWWAYRVLDSQYFGVAQRRRRVFIIGHLGAPCPPEILFEQESVFGDSAPSRRQGEGTSTATGEGTETGGHISGQQEVANSLPTKYRADPHESTDTIVVDKLMAAKHADTDLVIEPVVIDRASFNQGKNAQYDPQIKESETIPSLVARGPHAIAFQPGNLVRQAGADPSDEVFPTLGAETQGDQAPHVVSRSSAFHELAPTLAASAAGMSRVGGQGAEGEFYVGPTPRRLTPRECERLQGFPDDWTRYDDSGNEIADSPRYRMMGNAVTVSVAKWLGERFRGVEEK